MVNRLLALRNTIDRIGRSPIKSRNNKGLITTYVYFCYNELRSNYFINIIIEDNIDSRCDIFIL
jgi:hypothetical protein